MRVRGEDLECLLDLLLVCAAADVEEVRGLTAVQLDDVHRRHRQTGTVHCTITPSFTAKRNQQHKPAVDSEG